MAGRAPAADPEGPEEDAARSPWLAVAGTWWRRHGPRDVLAWNGEYYASAGIVPPGDAVENMFRTCGHYRALALTTRTGGAAEPAAAASDSKEEHSPLLQTPRSVSDFAASLCGEGPRAMSPFGRDFEDLGFGSKPTASGLYLLPI